MSRKINSLSTPESFGSCIRLSHLLYISEANVFRGLRFWLPWTIEKVIKPRFRTTEVGKERVVTRPAKCCHLTLVLMGSIQKENREWVLVIFLLSMQNKLFYL